MLKVMRSGWRLSVWLPALLLFAAALGAVAGAIEHLTDKQLRADAFHTATLWSRHVVTHVPDLDLAFSGDIPSPQAQERLLALQDMADLAQFKLLDSDGRLLINSLSIGSAPREVEHDAGTTARALASAAAGAITLNLQRGDGVIQPLIYTQAYVPVRLGPTLLGIAELTIDQAEVAKATRRSMQRVGLLASLALGCTVALGSWLTSRRLRQQRHAAERADYLVEHDLLTGALNRGQFSTELQKACHSHSHSKPEKGATEGGLAVLCIDLDHFNQINERYGLGVGDEVLRCMALQLRGVLRGQDLLARLSGDRFVVLQRNADNRQDVAALAQRVLDAVAQPQVLPGSTQGGSPSTGQTLSLTASVGAALLGSGGECADTLLHNAEVALSDAKSAGRANWRLYDAELNRVQQERSSLTQDLREALTHGGLQLHYQALFDARSSELCGYEALARWPHPLRGFVPPGEFIPLAEESGLIAALGRWVLTEACTEAARWPDPLTVAVNLSANQFRAGPMLVAEVAQVLQQSGLPSHRLELEITESLLMHDTQEVLETLRGLQALGTRIAMDDFGTGFSSLSYLWRFPFNKLKIDRAFTQGLGQDEKVDTIVRSIVALAHLLKMRVNAEGVETEAQRQQLQALACDELQGFLLARPQPASKLHHLSAVESSNRNEERALA